MEKILRVKRNPVSILQRIVLVILSYGPVVTDRLIAQQLPDVNQSSIPSTIAWGIKKGKLAYFDHAKDEATGRIVRRVTLNRSNPVLKGLTEPVEVI